MPQNSKISYSLHQQGFLEPLPCMVFAQKINGFEFPTTSFSDYNCFGMQIEERTFSESASSKYPYGMNGQMKDDEIYGEGNTYSAQYWEYDARLGRRWNLDPKPNPSISLYACFANNPIRFSDPNGDTILINLHDPSDPLYNDAQTIIKNPTNDGVYIIVGHSNPMGYGLNGTPYFEPQEFQNLAEQADLEQNSTTVTNADGTTSTTYNYGGKSYGEQVNSGDKVTVILYGCNTAANSSMEVNDISETSFNTPFAQRFSSFLAEKNTKSTVVGADGYQLGKKWQLVRAGTKDPKKQDGAWITFTNGQATSKRNVTYKNNDKQLSNPKIGRDKKIKE